MRSGPWRRKLPERSKTVYSIWKKRCLLSQCTFIISQVFKQLEKHKRPAWLQFQRPSEAGGAVPLLSVCSEVCRQRLDPTFRSRNEPPVVSGRVTIRMKCVPRVRGAPFSRAAGRGSSYSMPHAPARHFLTTSPHPASGKPPVCRVDPSIWCSHYDGSVSGIIKLFSEASKGSMNTKHLSIILALRIPRM